MKTATRSVFGFLFFCLSIVSVLQAIQQPPGKRFELKPEVWEKYLGEYLYGGNHYVSVFKFSQQAEDGALFFFDSETGRAGPLQAVSETEFDSGPAGAEMAVSTDDNHVTFLKNSAGRADRLLLKMSGRPDVEAKRAQVFSEERVAFASGETTLAGSLRVPATPGRHPAVVYVHGSGPGTRNQIALLAHFFSPPRDRRPRLRQAGSRSVHRRLAPDRLP